MSPPPTSALIGSAIETGAGIRRATFTSADASAHRVSPLTPAPRSAARSAGAGAAIDGVLGGRGPPTLDGAGRRRDREQIRRRSHREPLEIIERAPVARF